MGEFGRETLETTNKGAVVLFGGFKTNGGSSPTAAQIFGNFIQSVTRTGAGAYDVLLKPEFRNLDVISKQISLQLATPGDSKAQFSTYVKTTGVQKVATITTAAAADIAADADNIVWIQMTIRYAVTSDGTVLYDA